MTKVTNAIAFDFFVTGSMISDTSAKGPGRKKKKKRERERERERSRRREKMDEKRIIKLAIMSESDILKTGYLANKEAVSDIKFKVATMIQYRVKQR